MGQMTVQGSASTLSPFRFHPRVLTASAINRCDPTSNERGYNPPTRYFKFTSFLLIDISTLADISFQAEYLVSCARSNSTSWATLVQCRATCRRLTG